jgi:hypothetical protein
MQPVITTLCPVVGHDYTVDSHSRHPGPMVSHQSGFRFADKLRVISLLAADLAIADG